MTQKKKKVKGGSFDAVKDEFRKSLSFFREYPDYFIDYIKTDITRFDLTPFQRVFLRAFFRNKKVGIVASRGISKTYIDVMAHYLKCMMYPDASICLAMPTKTQSAKVVQEKVEELWRDYPILKNELLDWKFQKDYVSLKFRNGSSLDTLTVGESSRGLRANGIALEEIVDEKMDRDTINNVILPILAQPRMTKHGADPNEYSKTQAYITTASHKQSYCYEKYMELFTEMVTGQPTIVLGSSYEMGTRFGTLDFADVIEKKNSATYSPLSFDREYGSIFTGSNERSLVTVEEITRCRTVEEAEFRVDPNSSKKKDKDAIYVLAYDIARAEGKQTANSSLAVIKAIPRGDGTYQKFLVNMFTKEGTHFHEQALFLKKKVVEYNASVLVLDHNGIGRGVTDVLVTEIDANPPYSVINDDRYDRYKKANSIPMLHLIQAQAKESKNTNIVNVFMSTIQNGDIFMLKSESNMRGIFKDKDGNRLAEKLMPHIQVDRMIDEIMNLEYVQTGNTTNVKQISRSIEKDRYSALAYGIFYLYQLEQKNKQRKKQSFDASSFFAVKEAKYKIWN
ncbi:DNA packaging protein [Bacillus phage vB_BanS_Sophrita]|uniref:DNA packaging protein n=1 Tax=Bacillus phage vB_BanS_Sophrita TaxID=2894790 RepID=A0AAE9CE26_9CAUD|nr:DNA packaging protein [Bacillus phage vB_BanS_Sophrita]UGO50814.1 DNA packaging protein [Bacillus phage vB_BanS_Sophrita]